MFKERNSDSYQKKHHDTTGNNRQYIAHLRQEADFNQFTRIISIYYQSNN